jgi:hypothetical protein
LLRKATTLPSGGFTIRSMSPSSAGQQQEFEQIAEGALRSIPYQAQLIIGNLMGRRWPHVSREQLQLRDFPLAEIQIGADDARSVAMRRVEKIDLLLRHRMIRQEQAQLSIPDGLHSQEWRKLGSPIRGCANEGSRSWSTTRWVRPPCRRGASSQPTNCRPARPARTSALHLGPIQSSRRREVTGPASKSNTANEYSVSRLGRTIAALLVISGITLAV